MDRTSIIVIVLCFVLMGLWIFLIEPKLNPPKPLPLAATNAPAPTLAMTNPPAAPPVPSPAAEPAAPLALSTNAPEETIELTNGPSRYVFTSHGGGIKEVQVFGATRRGTTNLLATLNYFTNDPGAGLFLTLTNAPVLAVFDGNAVQGDGIFKLTRTTNGVRAQKELENGLSIVKDFQPDSNYLLTATVRFENRSSNALSLPAQEWFIGTATPADSRDKAVGVIWYNGSDSAEAGPATGGGGCACQQRAPPFLEKRVVGSNDVFWVAVHSQFFALAGMPIPADKETAQSLVIRGRYLPGPPRRPPAAGLIAKPPPKEDDAGWVATDAPPPQGYAATLVYPGLTLAPHETRTRQILVYAGPKEYQTLQRIADRLNNNLDKVMGFGKYVGFVSKGLLLGMNVLHDAFKIGYGWAIVLITVIIKLVFWPLTRASTRSMKRLQALQPQMNAIKEKYKDDPVKMNKKTMEFMRENKVSPLGGCLPMVLQIPVFIGFYTMIYTAFELHGASFLWVKDLSRPDTLFFIPFLDWVPLVGLPGRGLPFNLMPLLMGATMLWQSHLTPPSPGMDPAQQKIMRFMPLMFLSFLYTYSAGMTLYWTVQNLLTIVQTKLTRTATPVEPSSAPAKSPVLTPPQKKRK